MHVGHLSLRDYRNYREAEVSFQPGPNLIVGRNGQGKTNLVESLVFLSTLGSHRVSGDAALVRAGQDAAIVRAKIQYQERAFTLDMRINRSGANKAQVNGSALRTRELPRYISTVLFAPEDLGIIRGDPSARRRFLDELLVMHTPRLAGVLSDYERVVRQRNTLLKSARAARVSREGLSTLDVWNERLVEFGAVIMSERALLVNQLQVPLRTAYESVSGVDHAPRLSLNFSALSSAADTETENTESGVSAEAMSVDAARHALTTALERFARTELERGVTLVGPHRDDMICTLNSLPVKGYASHGETWSFALALKLGSADLLRRDSVSGDPILVLDDVFAELDEGRRHRLADSIGHFEQVLITAAVEADVPEDLRVSITRVTAGEIVDG